MVDIALRLDGVSRYLRQGPGGRQPVSSSIPSGAFVTLLGPSGCGKSTTLSLIAGLDRLDEGRILLGDEDITDTPPNERRMAMVFQNYALYPHMTAYDNIAFGLKLQHRPKDEIKQRVEAVAETLDITHLMKRKPGQMSGGQQQRVALGRALVKEPLVFLLDEPFSNLDAGLRSRMRTEVKHLHLKLGTTSVFVTHDQEEAMSLSDLIAVMRDGKIVQFGHDPGDLPQTRATSYVATFVGKPKMSLVDGDPRAHRRRGRVRSADLRIPMGSVGASRPARRRRGRRSRWASAPRTSGSIVEARGAAAGQLRGDRRPARADRLRHVRGAAGRRRHGRGPGGAGRQAGDRPDRARRR